jgi:hypothetical protein
MLHGGGHRAVPGADDQHPGRVRVDAFNSVTLQTAPLVVFPGGFLHRAMRHIVAVTCVTILGTITVRVSSATRVRDQFAPPAKCR